MPLCRPHWTCNSVFPIAPQMPCPAPGPEVSAATSCRSKVVQSAPQSVFGFQVLDHFFFLCKWEGCLCTCKYNCVEVRGQHGCWPSITVHLTGIFLFCFVFLSKVSLSGTWASHQDPEATLSPSLPYWEAWPPPAFLCGYWGLNIGSCEANTFQVSYLLHIRSMTNFPIPDQPLCSNVFTVSFSSISSWSGDAVLKRISQPRVTYSPGTGMHGMWCCFSCSWWCKLWALYYRQVCRYGLLESCLSFVIKHRD